MATKLTDTIVRRLSIPAVGKKITYDTEVAGFGCRVYASGTRTFVLNYRTRTRRERRITIGSFPDWTTTAARNEAADLKKVVDRGGDPLGDITATRAAPTVSDLCDRFIAEYLPRKRPSTQHTYRLQIDNEIRPRLGRHKVVEVTFADTDALHRKITARGTPYRANRVVALLSRMFSMAMRWQWRSDNPCRGVERNTEHKRRRYLTADELARLGKALDKYNDKQSANIIGLLLLTGARRGEVLAARWTDFDAGFNTWTKPGATTLRRLPGPRIAGWEWTAAAEKERTAAQALSHSVEEQLQSAREKEQRAVEAADAARQAGARAAVAQSAARAAEEKFTNKIARLKTALSGMA